MWVLALTSPQLLLPSVCHDELLSLTRPSSPSRACAKTHLEKGEYACQLVPYVRKYIQKRQWCQFLFDNVDRLQPTAALAEVCPSNRKTLPAKNCVSQTQTPYRGELHASVNKAVSVPFLWRLWYVRDLAMQGMITLSKQEVTCLPFTPKQAG